MDVIYKHTNYFYIGKIVSLLLYIILGKTILSNSDSYLPIKQILFVLLGLMLLMSIICNVGYFLEVSEKRIRWRNVYWKIKSVNLEDVLSFSIQTQVDERVLIINARGGIIHEISGDCFFRSEEKLLCVFKQLGLNRQ